jgi:hypothetical protein
MASKAKTQGQQSRAAAHTAGAGTGTLMVILANNLPEGKWKHMVAAAAPTLAIGISSGLVWIRAFMEKRRLEKQRREEARIADEYFNNAMDTIEEALSKPNLTEERRNELEQKRQLLEDSRINGQLALVLKLNNDKSKATASREPQEVAAG